MADRPRRCIDCDEALVYPGRGRPAERCSPCRLEQQRKRIRRRVGRWREARK